MGRNIVFTGGSGKTGQNAVGAKVERGCNATHLDLKPLVRPKVRSLIKDGGPLFNASTHILQEKRKWRRYVPAATTGASQT